MQAAGKQWLESVLALVAIAVAYFLLVAFSVAISMNEAGVATVWLANGAAAGLIQLRWRNRFASPVTAIVMGGLAANFFAGIPFLHGLLLTSVSALEVWLILRLITTFRERTAIQPHPGQTLALFTLLVFAPPFVSSLLISSYSTFFEGRSVIQNILIWWEVGAAGIVLTVPLFLFWDQRENYLQQGLARLVLIVASMLLLAALSVVVITNFRFPYILLAIVFLIFAIYFDTFLTAVAGLVFAATLYAASRLGLLGQSGTELWEEANRSMATAATILPALWLSFSLSKLERARTALFESREFLSRVQRDSPTGMAMLNPNLEITGANQSLRRMLDMGQDRIVGRKFIDFLHADDRPKVVEIFQGVLNFSEAQAQRMERQFLRADGSLFWGRLAVSTPLADGDKRLLIVQIEDIDESKRWQQQIEINNERWLQAFSSSRQGVWDTDLRTGKTVYTENWCQLIGYTQEEVGDSPDAWLTYLHPEDRIKVVELDAEHLAGGSPYFEYQFRMRHKDGHWVWILDRGQVIERGPSGEPLRLIGTHTDITDRVQAEEEVRVLSERVGLTSEAAKIGLWEWRVDEGGIWWNDRFLECHGFDPTTFSGASQDVRERIHPDDLASSNAALQEALKRNGSFEAEYRILLDGEERYVRSIGRSVIDEAGSQIFRGAVLDITEERQRMEQLEAAKERESQFAAVASHDLQAPLRHIAIHAEMLHRSLAGSLDPRQEKMLSTIAEKSQQAQDIIKGLLIFSRAPEEVVRAPVDLNAVVNDVVNEFRQDPSNRSATFEVGKLPVVLGDAFLLAQVFKNLIGNALKYAGQRPTITVSSRKQSQNAEIVVCDDGLGIPAQYADYVFEIFKRIPSAETKRGTGIGLSLCRRIVDAHKGRIWLDTGYEDGACFKVALPLPADGKIEPHDQAS